MSDSIIAGLTTLTRIPALAPSTAATRVSATMPPLLAVYAPIPAWPTTALSEAIFTIAPPPDCVIAGSSYLRQSQVPFKLVSITKSQSSSGFRDRAQLQHTRVVERKIKAAVDLHGLRHHALNIRCARHVGLHKASL